MPTGRAKGRWRLTDVERTYRWLTRRKREITSEKEEEEEKRTIDQES
jgi:hypothetical protein